MHLDPKRLRVLCIYSNRFYRRYEIAKRSGGVREILQPSRELKAIQAWILRNILDKLSPSPNATAFVSGRSLVQNVRPHAYNRYFLCVDIKDFFPTVPFWRVRRLFETIGYSTEAARLMTKICTCKGGLPQGAVTSPALSNLVAARLDRRLSGLTSRRNIVFTRYADDMTFSSNNRNALNKAQRLILDVIRSEGFTPHPEKLRVMGPRIHTQVTGLVKDSAKPRFGIGREKKRQMRVTIHKLVTQGVGGTKYPTEASVEGWLSYLKSVDPESQAQMTAYWQTLKSRQSPRVA